MVRKFDRISTEFLEQMYKAL